jgi:hypothetical protein
MTSWPGGKQALSARREPVKTRRTVKALKYVGGSMVLLVVVVVAGCVRVSGGTWYVRSAPVPEDWPQLTPVGEVHIKAYPVYRAAEVSDAAIDGDGMGPMFTELFRHIQSNEIAMTAPVEMGYDAGAASSPQMQSMAFLYRTRETGGVGDEGVVRVRDVQAQVYASVGVRGDYTDRNFEKGLAVLQAWLEENSATVAPIGRPRYLGYNGPFVPKFMRYGEVQIPVSEG